MTVTMAPSLAARGRHSDVPVVRTARGFRWGKLLETGVPGTVEDIASAKKINVSYVSWILRLTLFAPAIAKAIFEGRHSP